MGPITVIALAAVAGLFGAGVGLSSERLARRGRPEPAAEAESRLESLRWLAAAAAGTLAVKASLSGQPGLALAWLPLLLVAPWLVAVQLVGARPPGRVLGVTTFLTVNGVVLATAFTGRPGLLVSAALGFVLTACLAVLVRRLVGGLVTDVEVQIAALVGLACGSLGLPAVGIALVWAVVSAGAAWAFGRFRVHPVGTALLAGAWVAATLAL